MGFVVFPEILEASVKRRAFPSPGYGLFHEDINAVSHHLAHSLLGMYGEALPLHGIIYTVR
jgi:hypothetical protein